MPYCVIVARFNEPKIFLMGSTVREETVAKISAIIPQLTTTAAASSDEKPVMEYKQNPNRWELPVGKAHCDHMARSHMFIKLVELLEDEGWKMKGTHSITHPATWRSEDAGRDTTRIFLHRKE